MSERFSTAGMYLAYCVESTAGSRPTSGYTTIPEVKSIPSFNPSPEGIESTTLSETEYKTYVKGLKDLGQALESSAWFSRASTCSPSIRRWRISLWLRNC